MKYFSVDPAGNVETLHSLIVDIGTGAQSGASLTVTASPNTLWPPNHKDVTVTVSGQITVPSTSASPPTTVSYNVQDDYAPGSPILTGTAPVQLQGSANGSSTYSYSFTVSLEASRRGQDKSGRTYTINVTALDVTNGVQTPLASNFTTVVVPHDQGQGAGGEDQDTIDRDFIDGAFLAILGRVADQGGEDFFAQQMQNGMTPAQVVNILQHSPEYATSVVTELYQTVLGRAPDPSGLATFTGWIEAGATPQMVEQALLTSPEFNADHPDDAGFLAAAYQAILGRAPDAAGQAYFTGLLNQGVSRDVIIADLLYSPESDQDVITQTYLAALNRAPDASGDQFFLRGLERGKLNKDVIAMDLLTSPEFFVDATGTSQVAGQGGGD